MKLRPTFLVLLLLFGYIPAATANPETTKLFPLSSHSYSFQTANSKIDAVLNAPLFKNAIVGVLVQSLKDGRVIYERNADVALMPASNMKIVTAAAMLSTFAPTFRYTTTLAYTGKIEQGELKGDLFLKGSGDPSLTSNHLREMAEALKAAGVRKFHGRIIADATFFDDQKLGEGWQWDDEPYYYQAQVAGLNCDENLLVYEVRPGAKVGDPALVVIGGADAEKLGFSNTTYVVVQNDVKTVAAGGKTDVRFERRRARNEIFLSGTIATDSKPQTEEITVENPALFAATRLYELLPIVGIDVLEPDKRIREEGTTPAEATVAATHDSEPLSVLIAQFLKPSDNLFGECFLKTLGGKRGTPCTYDNGRKVVENFLKEQGVDFSGLIVADGSGLSRNNNVTARFLVGLLTMVDKQFPADRREAFVNGLPVGGVDGTLRNRFKGTPAQGRIQAKTGSLTGVSALSGFVTLASGERLVVSILMNHYTSNGTTAQARAAQDALILTFFDTGS